MSAASSDEERAALIASRETPEPAEGDPLVLDLPDSERARLLEGRKLARSDLRVSTSGVYSTEQRWRVDVLRRYIPNVGETGRGLLQFWGIAAIRKKLVGEKKWGAWKKGPEGRLHTVELTTDLEVS